MPPSIYVKWSLEHQIFSKLDFFSVQLSPQFMSREISIKSQEILWSNFSGHKGHWLVRSLEPWNNQVLMVVSIGWFSNLYLGNGWKSPNIHLKLGVFLVPGGNLLVCQAQGKGLKRLALLATRRERGKGCAKLGVSERFWYTNAELEMKTCLYSLNCPSKLE